MMPPRRLAAVDTSPPPADCEPVEIEDQSDCPVCGRDACEDPTHLPRPVDRSGLRPGPRLVDDVEILDTPAPVMLVVDRLPADALALLIGPPGGGKSITALDLAVSTATGRPWLGAPIVRSGPVVWVLAEGGPARFARRIAAAKQHADLPLDRRIGLYTWSGAPALLRPVDFDPLARAVAHLQPALVVLDTYSRLATGADENSASDTGLIVSAIDTLRGTHATVLALHHTPADGRTTPRGSSALLGAADSVLTLTANADGRLRLACTKQRDGALFAPVTFRLQPVADSVVPVLEAAMEEAGPALDDEIDRRILDALGTGPLSGNQLAKMLHFDRSLIFSRLQRLASAGRVHQTGAGPALRWRLS